GLAVLPGTGRREGSGAPACTRKKCAFVFATPAATAWSAAPRPTWIDLPTTGKIHSWTTCHFGSEAFLKETPYNLALVEFEGADSVMLVRLKDAVESDLYVGMPVEARFDPNPKYSITDVWFVPRT
ncbi:cytoplasmic protein, partial [mine drainage metagenome]